MQRCSKLSVKKKVEEKIGFKCTINVTGNVAVVSDT